MMRRHCQSCHRLDKAIFLPLSLALVLCCLGLAFNWRDLLLRVDGGQRLRLAHVDLEAVDRRDANATLRTANGGSGGEKRRAAAPRGSLNESAIRLMFSRLVLVAQKHSGPHRGRAAQMMARQLPMIDTSGWKLHSPSGRLTFGLADVQRVAMDTVGENYSVPNIAHYVLPFGNINLQFHHMVCLLSCLHVMRPARLLLWYAPGRLPQGEWWHRFRSNLTEAEWESRVVMVQREAPSRVYSVPVHSLEHKSDIMRLEALIVFGGVYLDMDVVVLKPLEPLRRRECTIGREVSYGLCNGALVAAPNATFLAMWHTAYQVFNDASWVDHSVWLPNSMNEAFPGLCHVEEESMHRPNWTPEEVAWIYGLGQQGSWDWRRRNYVMHLWFRKYGVHHNMDTIKSLNSMYGDICRYVLYGTV